MSNYLGRFKDISYKDAQLYGGKSCSLGEMLQAGIPVPNGFGISVEAQMEFNDKPFGDEFVIQLKNMFNELGLKRVAVRSSALAEDSSDASWAGQLESYLNVELDGLEDAIRQCWDSINTAHAISYAKYKGLKKEDLLVGVAVQAMVESEVAGVMFTADPIKRDRNNMMIEGLYGLGEMLVQGITTPDRYIVDKESDSVIDFEIAIKQQQMVYQDGKNRTEPVPENIADRAVLREKQVMELAHIGMKIESYYGSPQDIEWAFAKGKFYIVQSRPITTL